MARAKQTIKRTTTKIKTNKTATKTKVAKSDNKKKGNPNRCPACGRFI